MANFFYYFSYGKVDDNNTLKLQNFNTLCEDARTLNDKEIEKLLAEFRYALINLTSCTDS